ncbi:hypothetical protein ALQ15_112172 [Pseudomonas syringae pv. actinidiae]|uniref:Uncharacterized protein n=1 Tax=Pseudomonas syringae pv. actinidiae TaxID=103796 RepID=A0A7Z6XX98_PSESF|nr:hypothetical protein ALQ15_112172 [Pseudomonas syringae pv. actinidiae]
MRSERCSTAQSVAKRITTRGAGTIIKPGKIISKPVSRFLLLA